MERFQYGGDSTLQRSICCDMFETAGKGPVNSVTHNFQLPGGPTSEGSGRGVMGAI